MGYFWATTEGRDLVVKIASSTNKFRYPTNTEGPVSPPTQEDINKVFSMEPPFDLNSGAAKQLILHYREKILLRKVVI